MKKALPPTYFYAAIVLMVALHLVLPLVHWVRWPWRFAGVLFLVAGSVLNVWADGLFKKHDTEVKPFRESSSVVVEGPFRFSRNPMYLGGILSLVGVGLLLGSLSPFLVVPVAAVVMTYRFILQEERDMERQFGERYLEYKRRVRRWI
jgi:protein-S-isoprenylcysteine O-methyltransferase Ste14